MGENPLMISINSQVWKKVIKERKRIELLSYSKGGNLIYAAHQKLVFVLDLLFDLFKHIHLFTGSLLEFVYLMFHITKPKTGICTALSAIIGAF